MKIKIYAKLSIDEKTVHRILPQATVSPPIVRDQIRKDIEKEFNIIAIIDGKFDQSLAVAPSEIMDALRSGVRVYGASSMGALRAAETARYGAIGFGKIFEHIQATSSFRDDFLGQIFQDSTRKFKSVTYMDFYFSVQDLVSRRKMRGSIGKKLCSAFSNLHYTDRNVVALKQILMKKSEAKDLISALELVFALNFSQKLEDAIGLLKMIKGDISRTKTINSRLLKAAQRASDPFAFYPDDLLVP